ncbi:MAG: cupin [Chloroflexi bacterium]|nr:MAG: cupin [Chloroflexota bacterium]
MKLDIARWPQAQPPTENDIQQKIRAENLRGYTWSNGPYDEYSAHTHSFDKVLYVLAGSITWLLPQTNQEIETRAGDRIALPRGTVHAAKVGAQGVVCFEAHLE